MVSALDRNTHDDINLLAAFTTAFAAFLRPSEFTWNAWDYTSSPLSHLSRGSVKFTPAGVLLHLPKSKTDQFRKGETIPIASSPDVACPVKALKSLFRNYPRPPNHPLFCRLAGPFNKQWVSNTIESTLLNAGIDPTNYSGHSFRRGAANSAVAAGISRHDIKEMGRWKSDAVDRYFTTKSTQYMRFSANRRLHLAPSTRRASLQSAPVSGPSHGQL